MNIIRDFIVVKVPSIFIDESRYQGINGKTILLNVFHRPEHHVRTCGIVTSIPMFLGQYPIMQNPGGLPSYHDDPPSGQFKRMSDIPLEVQVGDKVYFHYNALLPDHHSRLFNHLWIGSKKEFVDGREQTFQYFRVKYDMVFAAVRYEKLVQSMPDFNWKDEGKLEPFKPIIDPRSDAPLVREDRFRLGESCYRKVITMIGSYVLVEPDMESWKEISIPIPQSVGGRELKDRHGETLMKPESEWLVTKAQPEERYLQGWIRHIGSPLIGDDLDGMGEGMYVHFRPLANTKMDFEGKEFFRMRQRHIHAYIDLEAYSN